MQVHHLIDLLNQYEQTDEVEFSICATNSKHPFERVFVKDMPLEIIPNNGNLTLIFDGESNLDYSIEE